MIRRDRALAILDECTGDEIWSVDRCRLRGVPEAWVEELADALESGWDDDRQTIYVGDRPTNQYHGVRDVDLAKRAAEALGMDVERIADRAWDRRDLVRRVKEAVVEGD